MTEPVPPGMLGRQPTDPARLAHTIRLPLTGVVPAHPLVADHLSSVPQWILGGNDKFGTCGPTSIANYCVLLYKYLLGEDITVTDEAVFDLYRQSGNPGFDPATGADDNGVDMTVMLSALVSGGITITHADGRTELVRPYCYAAHPVAIDQVRAVTSIFGASILAVDLDVAQQGQTNSGLWDYAARSGTWGGHAIPGGSYTSSAAAHTADESVITWQLRVGTTDTFIAQQLTEAYVVVFPVLWDHPAFQAGVDQAALAAAYTAETGRAFPVPVPLPPPPPPVPPAPPGPAPDTDLADDDLALAVSTWSRKRHTGSNALAAAAVRDWLHVKGFR